MGKKEICKCEHTRGMHNGVKTFEDGQVPPPFERDEACRASNNEITCTCEKYELVK